MTLFTLGDFDFTPAASAFDSLSISDRYNIQPIDRLGRAPSLQFTGKMATETEFEFSAYPDLVGTTVDEAFARLRTKADKGEPQRLTDFEGNNLGQWLISELTRMENGYRFDGSIFEVKFKFKIMRYEP